jgi:type I restriction enzyme S subunit
MDNSDKYKWEKKKISEFAKTHSGGTPSTTKKEYWDGNIPWINSGKLKDEIISSPSRYITEMGLKESSAKLFPKGTTVIALTGATTGKVGLLDFETSTNQSVVGIYPNEVLDNKLLFYQLLALRETILGSALGSAQPHINKKIVDELEVLVPPLQEQERIVAKLDSLFAHLEEVKIRLEKVPEILKQFRQAVLTQAVSGKLTEDWRVNVKWEECNIRDVAVMDVGFAFKSQEFSDSGIRLLRGQNIEPGSLRWTETVYFPEEKLANFNELYINEGDVLLAMDRPIISSGLKLAIAKKEDTPSVLVQRVARFKETDKLVNKFLYYVLGSQSCINYLFSTQTGTQIPHLSGKHILGYQFKLPPLKEQTEIVRRVESLFAKVDAIEAQYKNLKEKIDQLPQAILAKAFRGEV